MIFFNNTHIMVQAEMHDGSLHSIVQCTIICSDNLVWKAGTTFVLNKYLKVNKTTCLECFYAVHTK